MLSFIIIYNYLPAVNTLLHPLLLGHARFGPHYLVDPSLLGNPSLFDALSERPLSTQINCDIMGLD